jgi:phosphoribosylglycinamide formyltransferase 1
MTGTAPSRKRVGVLISGRGSNMSALIAAAKSADFPAEIVVVGSNKADAAGLASAATNGIATFAINHKDYTDREAFDRAVQAELMRQRVEIVCLAGFMRILSPWFCRTWEGRMLNIHPSLLPLHKGLDTHRRALEAGDAEHGCTVHLVTAELDDGPVLAQARVPILPGDTEATLAARVLAQEHIIYPEALARLCQNIVTGENGASDGT